MQHHVHVADRAALAAAAQLLCDHGAAAEAEARARAEQSRVLGNMISFCHWRQIGRAVTMLRVADVTGSVH